MFGLFLSPLVKVGISLLSASDLLSMEKWFSKKENKKLELGDIVGVSRGAYDHYGVYIGGQRVIHYTSLDSDTSSNNTIMETDFKTFLRGKKEFFILDVSYLEPSKFKKIEGIDIAAATSAGVSSYFLVAIKLISHLKTDKKFKYYSNEETIKRAKSRLGEKSYSLLTNNCEHFAIWCRTGISDSQQVNKVLDDLKRISLIKVYGV